MGSNVSLTADSLDMAARRRLFLGCFVALVATSFAFIIRVMVMGDWQIAFALSETQKGEVFGAGLWPFGLSIVLFSLIIDKIGYGRSMIFAFACHVASTILLVTAHGYWGLYIGSFLNGLAAGTVEAVINPAVASMYPRQKTKMLTILHAGWPGGFVLGGILIMAMGSASWVMKVAIILLPTLAYGAILLRCHFPVSERVAAGVPYREMLKEAGALGCLIVVYMICMEINRLVGLGNILDTNFFDLPSWPFTILIVVLTGAYWIYTRSLGRPMYVFLLFVMILLAITELGTDTWIKELMTPAMTRIGINAGWVLIYTATIMMVLRFCISPIEKKLRPLGVLLGSALFAAAGLYFLSRAEGIAILIMATIYGTGQCFFWPVTLGLVSEQFPKGGALTLNAIAGVGMLGVGILGSQLLGFWQDTNIDRDLQAQPAAYERLMETEGRKSIFGDYRALDGKVVSGVQDKTALYEAKKEIPEGTSPAADESYCMLVGTAYDHLVREPGDRSRISFEEMYAALDSAGVFVDEAQYESLAKDREVLQGVTSDAKRSAMSTVAVLPIIMAACYLGLILYFKSRGGYEQVHLEDE